MKDRCCGGSQLFVHKWVAETLVTQIIERSSGTAVVFCPYCYMALKTFSSGRKVVYLTDLLLFVMGERKTL